MTANQFQRPRATPGRRKRPGPDEYPLPDPVSWSEVFGAQPNRNLALGLWCPEGRATAVYSPAKEGKSSFVLHDVYEALSEMVVTYLDKEMALDDLREILNDLGATEAEMINLRYYVYPSLPLLDQPGGGEYLVRLCQRDGSRLVVFDTAKRFVEGDESENDTWQRFWTYTGSVLKQAGITWIRLAHAGKDLRRGQRGGSSLNDDVDVVWELQRTDDGTRLKRMFSRVSWLPEEIDYVRRTDPVRFVQSHFSLPPGTLEVAALLDRLGLPPDVSGRIASNRLRDAGHSARNEAVFAAVKHRKYLTSNSEAGSTAGSTLFEGPGSTAGEHLGAPDVSPGRSTGAVRGAPGSTSHSVWGAAAPPIGGSAATPGLGAEQALATPQPSQAETPCRRKPSKRPTRRPDDDEDDDE